MLLFILGLLVILRLNPLFNVLTQVISDSQVILAIGVITEFAGQALVVFGAMRSTSNPLVSNLQAERRITLEGFNQNTRQLQNTLLSEQQALKTQYLQSMAKMMHWFQTKKHCQPGNSTFDVKLQVLRSTNQPKSLLPSMRKSKLNPLNQNLITNKNFYNPEFIKSIYIVSNTHS